MNDTRLQPNVSSGARPVAETIRQLIEFGFQTIRNDINAPNTLFIVDELFSMWGSEVISQVKSYLKSHPNIPVVSNWPKTGLGIPQICVVTQSENEKADNDFLGDQTGLIGRGAAIPLDANQNPLAEVVDNNLVQRYQRGVIVGGVTSVFVRAEESTLCIYLTHIVRLIIFMNKLDLIRDADIHNLTIDIAEITDGAELFPEFAYTRQVGLTYLTQFDYNLPEQVLRRLSYSLLVNPAVIEPLDGSVHDENAVAVPYSK